MGRLRRAGGMIAAATPLGAWHEDRRRTRL